MSTSIQLGARMQKTQLGCNIHIMGSSGDQQNVGDSNYHVQGLDAAGQWSARQWDNQGVQNINGQSTCGTTYYQLSEQNSGEIMKFYDTRNSL